MIVNQLHPHFMAEVTGLDLLTPLTPDQARAVQQAIDTHAVLVFRHQAAMDDEAQIGFSALFGPLQRWTPVPGEKPNRALRPAEPGDFPMAEEEARRPAAEARRRLLQRPARLWHTDSSFQDPPGRYTFLAARILPPEGGDTEFADMRAAYDALDEVTKLALTGLRVFHSLGRSRLLADAPALSPDEERNLPGAEQPLVRRHPSGRDALYLASHAESIVGWDATESRELLDRLTEHAIRPEFVHSHQWRGGDFVMWDNRCTMHRATPFRDDHHRNTPSNP